MILVFAPNPALERVALVDKFEASKTQKPMRVSTFAGGAGLRAASVVRLLGGDVLALGCVGGHTGALLQDHLDRQDIPHVLTPIAADTRGDFLLLDRERGVITEIPEAAPARTEAENAKLLTALERHIKNAALLIIADGQDESDPTLFSRAIATAKSAGVPVIAEAKESALEAAIAGGVWLLRVNLLTLQKRTERSLQYDRAIIEEAGLLREKGVENLLVTFGEEGALLITGAGAWRIKPPVVSHFNPTACGETLTGALASHYEVGRDLLAAARYGCAAASVNVTHDEPGYATPAEVAILYPRTLTEPIIIR